MTATQTHQLSSLNQSVGNCDRSSAALVGRQVDATRVDHIRALVLHCTLLRALKLPTAKVSSFSVLKAVAERIINQKKRGDSQSGKVNKIAGFLDSMVNRPTDFTPEINADLRKTMADYLTEQEKEPSPDFVKLCEAMSFHCTRQAVNACLFFEKHSTPSWPHLQGRATKVRPTMTC